MNGGKFINYWYGKWCSYQWRHYFDSLDKNDSFIEEEIWLTIVITLLKIKNNNNVNSISIKTVCNSSGDNSCRSWNFEGWRYPKHVTNATAYLNDYDVHTGEDVVNFLDYCYLLSIPKIMKMLFKAIIHKNGK